MSGRKENENKMKDKLEWKLTNYPSYLKSFYYSMADKSYTTKNAYINNIIHFLDFVDYEFNIDTNDVDELNKIKPSNINIYISSMDNLSNGTKAGRLYAIKSFFDFLVNDEHVKSNPVAKVKIPKDNEEHKITFLTKKEIGIIKKNIEKGVGSPRARAKSAQFKKRDYAIIMLALSLGLRVTSLTEINISDIDFDKNEIKIVVKGNKIRRVKFSDNIKTVLNDWLFDRRFIMGDYLSNTDALFVSERKIRISAHTVAEIVKKYTYNIDKHITPHKLRSTCATNVYNATGDIYLTADILGHANIANTRRYAQISDERKEKAASAMDKILF